MSRALHCAATQSQLWDLLPVVSWAFGLFGKRSGSVFITAWGRPAQSDISDNNLLF
jgi:hypothetical protein